MIDTKAPSYLKVVIYDADGREWGSFFANQKNYKTGTKGYSGTEKIRNPENQFARYQCNFSFYLIGSKKKEDEDAE